MNRMQTPAGTLRCLITTISFGMGVNVSDISQVLHWGCSSNILSWWQEVGRAGRGEQKSETTMYCIRNKLQNVDEDMLIWRNCVSEESSTGEVVFGWDACR